MADLPIPPYLQSPHPDDDAATTTTNNDRNPAVGVGGLPSESQLLLLCLDYLRDLRRSYTNDELAAAESIDGDWLSLGIYGLSRSLKGSELKSAFGGGGVANAATVTGGSVAVSSAVAGTAPNPASVGNDAWFDPIGRSSALGRQTSQLHRITTASKSAASNNGSGGGSDRDGDGSGGLMIPSTMDDINREVLYVRDPDASRAGLPPSSPPRAGTRAAALSAARRNRSGGRSAAAAAGAGNEVPSDPSEWYVHDDAHPSNLERFYPLNGLASERSPLSLGEIAAAGLTGLGARSRLDAEREMVESDLFGQFLGAVKDKGFFDGTIVGDDQAAAALQGNGRGNGTDGTTVATEPEKRYEERYRKVVAKFRTKLAAKAANTAGGGVGGGGGSVISRTSAGGSVVSQPAVDAAERQRRRRQKRIEAVKGGKDPSEIRDSASSPNDKVRAASPATTADTPMNTSHMSNASFNQIDIDEAERLKSTGNACMQKKQYDKAVDAYTSALKVVPNGPTSHVYYSNRAAALLSMKSFEEAIKDSERSLALKPDYGKAHARLGLAQFLLGRYQEAVDTYEVALELDPDNKASRSYLEKAKKKLAAQNVVNEKSKRSSAAAPAPSPVQRPPSPEPKAPSVTGGSSPTKTYEQQRIDEKEANRYKSKGNACMASRDYEGAISAYTSALELCPDGPSSHVYFSNRAAALCYLERYEEAEMDSETSVELRPDYGKGYARLGLSRFFLRDYGGAVLAYQEALKYEPDNMASRSYLAKATKKVEQEEGGDAQDDESEI